MLVLRSTTRRTVVAATAFLTAAALSLSATGTASAEYAYRIVNQNSGKALMPFGRAGGYGDTAWRRPIRQRPVDYADHRQLWFMTADGRGTYRFENYRSSGWCIHPWDWTPVSGSRLLLGGCRGDASARARKWSLRPASSPTCEPGYTFTIRSNISGLYMDIEGKSTRTNALAVQAPRDGTTSQIWCLDYEEV